MPNRLEQLGFRHQELFGSERSTANRRKGFKVSDLTKNDPIPKRVYHLSSGAKPLKFGRHCLSENIAFEAGDITSSHGGLVDTV